VGKGPGLCDRELGSDGERRICSLRRKPFRALDAWIHEYREIVEARFERIERPIERAGPSYHSTTKYSRRN
jgi:hypothetical protein